MNTRTQTQQVTQKASFTINASIKNLDNVREEFLAFLASKKVSDDDTLTWQLIFAEVVANAITHGSSSEKDLVLVEWEYTPAEITLLVADSGAGPHPNQFEIPALPEDVYSQSGRGLYIISRFASRWDHSKTPSGYKQLIGRIHPSSNN